MRLVPLLAFMLASMPLRSQVSATEKLAKAAIRPPLNPEAVLDNLEHRARTALNRIQHPVTRGDVEAQRGDLRKRLRESLGHYLLPWPPDLRSTLTGTIPRDGYRLEKIIFQSLPDMIVTAHLYVPDGLPVPAPAVLISNGHSKEGKAVADTQAFCINMARLGFVVLTADPLGHGERESKTGHRHPEALLVGLSEPGIVEYETQCALEYLRSRMEVDAARIGMTGADGGGFNTWITSALDDRIAAAIPVDDTFDFLKRIHEMRALDWSEADDQCQLIPGILQYANMEELIAMTAPRRLMIIASSETREIYEYAQRVYASLGVPGNLRRFESDAGGYGRQRREAAYGFFVHALMNRGDGSPVEEPRTEISPPDSHELACLPRGSAGMAGDRVAEVVTRLAKASSGGVSLETLAGPPPDRVPFHIRINPLPLQRENIATEKGIEVPVTILRPGPDHAGGAAGILWAIDDKDKETLASDPIVQAALQRDWLVIELDPRGFGELKTGKPGWVFATSLLLGENFTWRQAWDLRFLLDNLSGSPHAVYARGPNASLVASYAVLLKRNDEAPNWAVLRGGYTSLCQFLEYPAALKPAGGGQSIPYEYFAFRALRAPGIPRLLSGAKAMTLIIDPMDAERARREQSGRVRVTGLEEFIRSGW